MIWSRPRTLDDMAKNQVVITGIGLLSSLGEGGAAHWQALNSGASPALDEVSFAPYVVHRLGEVDWSRQIPKRGDQRQMETWQRLGTYAAGLALDDAALKGDTARTTSMDMIIAAGGGERDIAVDTQILNQARQTAQGREVMLNEMLSSELRPTLFLAQLSNLLAGNISIVHQVTGSSRSLMGEEGAGLSAIETAVARIEAGQSSHILVGASYNSEHYDMLLGHELGQYLQTDGWTPVWQREGRCGGGLITGSAGVFLVLEAAEHAANRGCVPYARIDQVITDQINRRKKRLEGTLGAMIAATNPQPNDFAVSAAGGVHGITAAERQALEGAGLHYRAFSSLFGHMREAQFIFALALAALTVKKGQAFAPCSRDEPLHQMSITRALVTMAGICRAEGVVRLVKV